MTNSALISNGRKELFAIREEYTDAIAKANGGEFGIGNSIEAGNCVEESIRMLQAVDAKEDDVITISEFLNRIERSTAALLMLGRYTDEVINAIEHSLEHGETEYEGAECPVCRECFIADLEYRDHFIWDGTGYAACCSDTCEHKHEEDELQEQKSDIEGEFAKAIESEFNCEFESWNDDESVWELIHDSHAYDRHEYSEGWHRFDYADAVSNLEEDDLIKYCSHAPCDDIEAREEADELVYDAIIENNNPGEFELQMSERKVPCVGATVSDGNGHELYIHRAESGLGWKVTHGPSGLGFGKVFYMATYLDEANEKSEYHRAIAIAKAFEVTRRFCLAMFEMFSAELLSDWNEWGQACGKTIKQVRDNAIEIAEAAAQMR